MATCSDGYSFYLDADYTYDGLTTYDGCYSDSGFTENGVPEYFRGGEKADGVPVVFATVEYGTTEVWVLAIYDLVELTFDHRCKDADENDAKLIHPTEVTEWKCTNSDMEYYTRYDAVTTTCGCPTPSPTSAPTSAPTLPEPTPAPSTRTPTAAPSMTTLAPSTPTPEPVSPSSCGATEPFRITSGGLPEVEGCFQATPASFSNPNATLEMWSVSGNTDFNQVVVAGLADDGTGEVSDSPYLLTYFAEVESNRIFFCQSNEDAITVHPVDATWQCDVSGNGSFLNVTNADISFDCGCITAPAPAVSETPSPTPEGEEPPVPLGAVIGGSFGGAALLVIVGLFVWRRRANNGISGNSPHGGRNYPVVQDGSDGSYPVVGGGAATAVAVPVAGSKDRPTSRPPPPAYPEGPVPKAGLVPASGDVPPPPAYSEPPAYSG